VRHGPSRCLGVEEAWASSGCSVLTLCVSGGVGLDRPPPGETFCSLLGGEGGQLRGLTHEPGSPRVPGGRRKLCLLVSRPERDPVRGAVGRGAPREWRQGAPRHRQPGACLLVPGPWLASLAGQEPRTGLGHAVDRKPKARGMGEAPEPQAEAAVESGSAGSLCQRVHASVPDRHGPQALGRS
jgi:hypothetical protein